MAVLACFRALGRCSQRTGAGEPHCNGPRTGSGAHAARHRPQDRM